MPSLILLNGPPAAGKSTLARMYADDHSLALNLDIDRLRAQLGRWREDRGAAGLAARRITLAAARAHLAAGHDVVVPQLVARLEFIEQLEVAALDSGAAFREVMLLDEQGSLRSRYRDRVRQEAAAGHEPIAATDLTDAQLAEFCERLLPVVAARPATIVIRSLDGDVAATYRELVTRLVAAGGPIQPANTP
ncbi:MAG: AAA family ATPase [Streptosporangiaceae bacterium]